jgi:hypothetical protein
MGTMVDHGAEDEVITMINSARVAQRCREVPKLHMFLNEIITSAKRWEDETNRIARKAEEERYSPEATVTRLRKGANPRRLTPPETGAAVNLTITARLSHGLMQSSAELLRAEQVYGPFWTIRSRCFVVPRGVNAHAAFLAYKANNPQFAKKDYRLLNEYRLLQNTYRNVEIYMLMTLPRLFALRDTKILELGMSTREQMQLADMEARLPIIERAELIVSRLPKIVPADSKRYMVQRLVEYMLLDEKRTKLRNARWARDGEPPRYTAANSLLSAQRFAISSRLADRIGVIPQEIHKAITNRAFSSYIGAFLRAGGRAAWEEACALVREWHKLKKMAEV